jgi:alpha-acetolactate decarboxylase
MTSSRSRRLLWISVGLTVVGLVFAATPTIRCYGSLRAMYHEGQTAETVRLADLLPDTSLYAVGALTGLTGEVTVVGGKAYLSYPAGEKETRTESTTSPTVGATLLVTADVAGWREVKTERAIPFEELDTAIAALAAQAGIPKGEKFPFLVEGEVEALEWHVIDGKRLAPGASGHQAHLDASVRESAKRSRATLVGFYSESDEGVFTHAGSKTHVHCVVAQPLSSGHVDHVAIPAGTTIKLPIRAGE